MARGLGCLDPHDLVLSKLVAGREKDFEFARALLDAGLVRIEVLLARAELLRGVPAIRRRVTNWLEGQSKPGDGS